MIDRQPVQSSNIAEVGHVDDTLEIKFHSGGVYRYRKVPQDVYEALMAAKSVGRYFHQQIKGVYEWEKVK